EQFASGRFIKRGMDVSAHRHPFLEPDITALEEQSELLPIQALGLGEAVIHVHQNAVPIAHRAIDLLLQSGAGAEGALGGGDLARSKPAIEQIKKMHSMLDEDAAALFAVPEPMFGRQPLVAGVVLKIAVEKFA